MWTLCAVLTALNAFEVGSPARTDAKLSILLDAPWFQFPYPGRSFNNSKIIPIYLHFQCIFL